MDKLSENLRQYDLLNKNFCFNKLLFIMPNTIFNCNNNKNLSIQFFKVQI